MKRILTLFIFISVPLITRAQIDSIQAHRDSTGAIPLIARDSTAMHSSKVMTGFRPTKKPWVAVGLSAAVPGAGQIYNETYWKLPIIWGLGGYWIYEWVKQNGKYQDFRQQYSASISPLLPNGNNQYLQLRDFYRDERDAFAWYLGALYFLNLVDAYVGANLYDFDVSPDLSADGKLVPKVMATVRVKF